MQLNALDKSHNLRADLALCEAASPGPWVWWDIKDSGSGGSHESLSKWGGAANPISEQGRTWGLGHPSAEFDRDRCVLVADDLGPLRGADADFIADARVGWPVAIRRAMAAEAEVRRLRRRLKRRSAQQRQGPPPSLHLWPYPCKAWVRLDSGDLVLVENRHHAVRQVDADLATDLAAEVVRLDIGSGFPQRRARHEYHLITLRHLFVDGIHPWYGITVDYIYDHKERPVLDESHIQQAMGHAEEDVNGQARDVTVRLRPLRTGSDSFFVDDPDLYKGL